MAGTWFTNTMVTLEVHDTTDADAIGGNPIMMVDGTVVGRATVVASVFGGSH